jgi:hypothetical protein
MVPSIKGRIKDFIENHFEVEIRKKRSQIPGMISAEERLFLRECSRDMQKVPGVIVDLGTWLGASAASLAEGIRDISEKHDQTNKMIYTFDRFLWEESMDVTYLPDDAYLDYREGDSFLPQTRTNLKDYQNVIQLAEEDLGKYVWDKGEIKLLHVDAMKSLAVSRIIARNFYPSLAKDSILIHQDFKHWYTPWIHLMHFRLRNYFSFIHEVKKGGMVAFRTDEILNAEMISHATDFQSFQHNEVDDAFEFSFSITSESAKPKIAAAHVMHYVHEGKQAEAESLFKAYSRLGYAKDNDMCRAKEFIKNQF